MGGPARRERSAKITQVQVSSPSRIVRRLSPDTGSEYLGDEDVPRPS